MCARSPTTVTRSRRAGSRRTWTIAPSSLRICPTRRRSPAKPLFRSICPLDVLIERSLVPRGIGVKPFEQFLPPSEFAPLAILDRRVVVPAYVEPPEQREIDKFDQPPQMTAELREIVEPDIFNTGEANLLVRAGRSQRRQVGRHHPRHFRRGAHCVHHLSGFSAENFPARMCPRAMKSNSPARNSASSICRRTKAPSRARPSPPPGPVVKITPKALNKAAPPRPEEHRHRSALPWLQSARRWICLRRPRRRRTPAPLRTPRRRHRLRPTLVASFAGASDRRRPAI